MRMKTSLPRRQAGFTLIELITTLVLLGLLASIGTSIVSDNFRTVNLVNARQGTAERVRYAMDRVAREIRETKYASSSGYAITSMSANSFAFKRDIAGSEVTITLAKAADSSNVTLAYSLPAASSTLIDQATGFALQYLDLNGQPTTSALDVRFIVVTLSVQDTVSGSQVSERMRIALRNS
jgi:prepilin-type N-terminal cleavage/methylation domain-containing protein